MRILAPIFTAVLPAAALVACGAGTATPVERGTVISVKAEPHFSMCNFKLKPDGLTETKWVNHVRGPVCMPGTPQAYVLRGSHLTSVTYRVGILVKRVDRYGRKSSGKCLVTYVPPKEWGNPYRLALSGSKYCSKSNVGQIWYSTYTAPKQPQKPG